LDSAAIDLSGDSPADHDTQKGDATASVTTVNNRRNMYYICPLESLVKQHVAAIPRKDMAAVGAERTVIPPGKSSRAACPPISQKVL